MRPLGEALAGAGFPVHAPRLAGHATEVADLARVGWRDWFASVEAGLETLAGTAPRVAIVGMSLGALLALHLAAVRPAAVEALVLCGTPLRLRDPRVRLLPALAQLPWLARRWAVIPKRDSGPDIADPAARAASRSYRAMPLPALVELLRLRSLVRREVRRVRQPTLLLHGRDDHSVPVGNLDLLRRALGSARVEAHVLERSWHVVVLDRDRAEVARLTADFLARVEAGAP